MTATAPGTAAPSRAKAKETPKEALIGLVISFAVVLIYRGFIFETFHIPTGSMAPTLRGAHMQFTSPQSGFTWAVNPWTDNKGVPTNPQGSAGNPVRVSDPVTGVPIQPGAYPLRSGDRIAVLKYNWLHHPKRWDVIVFKMPENPRENYIKRLVGLSNEDLWLVDGDVFVRPSAKDSGDLTANWSVARKPAYIQDDVWWTIHSSELAPLKQDFDGVPWRSPWRGAGWTRGLEGEFSTDSAEPSVLEWDTEYWPITDFTAYNQVTPWAPNHRDGNPRAMVYPTSDLRVRAMVVPEQGELDRVAFTIAAQQHEFRAVVSPSSYLVQMRAEGATEWTRIEELRPGPEDMSQPLDIEFANVDQSLHLRVNGRLMADGVYDWSPLERLRNATRLTDEQLDAVLENPLDTTLSRNPAIYHQPQVSIETRGAPVTLHRVGIDRDLFYQPAMHFGGSRAGAPGLASHPDHIAHIGDWEFFAAGDNSGSSRDSRLWDTVNPWVLDQTGAQVGMVPGDMLMGEAVVVFWPAPNVLNLGPIRLPFVPDVGRTRLIK